MVSRRGYKDTFTRKNVLLSMLRFLVPDKGIQRKIIKNASIFSDKKIRSVTIKVFNVQNPKLNQVVIRLGVIQ